VKLLLLSGELSEGSLRKRILLQTVIRTLEIYERELRLTPEAEMAGVERYLLMMIESTKQPGISKRSSKAGVGNTFEVDNWERRQIRYRSNDRQWMML
jgi:hypothetical protein